MRGNTLVTLPLLVALASPAAASSIVGFELQFGDPRLSGTVSVADDWLFTNPYFDREPIIALDIVYDDGALRIEWDELEGGGGILAEPGYLQPDFALEPARIGEFGVIDDETFFMLVLEAGPPDGTAQTWHLFDRSQPQPLGDFILIAEGSYTVTEMIPEPGAALLFALGTFVVGTAVLRERSRSR